MSNCEVKKFGTEYNPILIAFLVIVVVGIWIPVIIYGETEIVVYVIHTLISAMIISILVGTYYYISDGHLYYRSGPFRGKIDILKIRKIENDDDWIKTSLWKLGLSHKGFKIYYDKFNDVFLSPKDKTGFVKALLKINPEIHLIGYQTIN